MSSLESENLSASLFPFSCLPLPKFHFEQHSYISVEENTHTWEAYVGRGQGSPQSRRQALENHQSTKQYRSPSHFSSREYSI